MTTEAGSTALGRVDVLGKLSQGQRAALGLITLPPARDLLVTACPGSGKTTSITARAAYLMSCGKLIALTTYTNVAADEILSALEEKHRVSVPEACFVGTLHKFLTQYILHPFQTQLLPGAPLLSVTTGETNRGYELKDQLFKRDDFTFNGRGDIIYTGRIAPWIGITAEQVAEHFATQVRSDKEKDWYEGTVTADDSMHLCRMILETTDAGCVVGNRFDELIVDEAQDCSPNQVECLRLIKQARALESLVLVGDFDQSIYGFQGAAPHLVKSLSSGVQLAQTHMSENFRSSQAICNLFAKLRASAPDKAVGANAACEFSPICIIYPSTDRAVLPSYYTSILTERGISASRSRIIARFNATVTAALGGERPWTAKFLASMIELAMLGRENVSWKDVQRAEQSLVARSGLAPIDPGPSGLPDRLRVRSEIVLLADTLPDVDLGLGAWIIEAKRCVSYALRRINPNCTGQLGNDDWAHTRGSENVVVRGMLRQAPEIECSTVHGAKGLSLESVLLLADVPSSNYEPEADLWRNYFTSGGSALASSSDETARILYVGLSRAERLCCIAVPQTTSPESIETFASVGFEIDTSLLREAYRCD